MSLNQSIAQYSLSDCHIEWLNILKHKQIPAGSITFEIAENLFFEQKDSHLESIQKLKQAGIQVSLDGFGTGYSSLNYLKKYPIDALKIDRSYIHTMVDDPTNAILVETIIILANKLGIKVIATGVENAEQLTLLNPECRYAQGYYFSRPLPFNEFKKYIETQQPAKTKKLTS
ncbi:MAG: EAL domain-containing protein [Methyloprofundus sp.]|nr:EAL domain-containing protein [Methyloprofundus sp.]